MNISVKKAGLVSAVSFIFLAMCSTVAYVLRYLSLNRADTVLYVGLGILSIGGILLIAAKKYPPLNIPVYFISAIALGFCIRSWYLFREFDNSLFIMLVVSACAVMYLWAFFVLSKIPIFRDNPVAFISLYLLLSATAYIFLVIFTHTTYVSTLGYYVLVEMAFIYAMYTDAETPEQIIRSFALSTFSVFSSVAFVGGLIALAVLGGDCDADADCCECIECCDGTSLDVSDAKNKRKSK